MHLFDFYRRLLMIVCAVYATVRLVQGVMSWRRHLMGRGRQVRLARGYVGWMAASIRIRRFWPDLLEIVVLAAVLIFVINAHRYVMG